MDKLKLLSSMLQLTIKLSCIMELRCVLQADNNGWKTVGNLIYRGISFIEPIAIPIFALIYIFLYK